VCVSKWVSKVYLYFTYHRQRVRKCSTVVNLNNLAITGAIYVCALVCVCVCVCVCALVCMCVCRRNKLLWIGMKKSCWVWTSVCCVFVLTV